MSRKVPLRSLTPELAYTRGYTAGKRSADRSLQIIAKANEQQTIFWQNKCAELLDRLKRYDVAIGKP